MERFILLRGEINPDLVARFSNDIESWLRANAASSEPLTVLISSRGGSSDCHKKLIDRMEALGRPWVAKIYIAASAAAEFALSAPVRHIVAHGTFMFHLGRINVELQSAAAGGIPWPSTSPDDWAEFQGRVLKLIERNAPGLPPEELQTLRSTSWLDLSPVECLQYGIVHEIV